jgi:hypothetical protein
MSAPVLLGIAAVTAVFAGTLFWLSRPTAPTSPTSGAQAEAMGTATQPRDVAAASRQPLSPEVRPSSATAEASPQKRTEAAASEPVTVSVPDKSGTVVGQVVDYTGNPASGVKIRILAKTGFPLDLTPDAVTGADGKFAAKIKVNKKKTMRLRASRNDRLPISIPEVVIKRDETTDLGVLQFEAVGSLDVLVVDRNDRPVPNVPVVLDRPGEGKRDRTPTFRRDNPGEAMERGAEEMRGRRTTGEDGFARFAAVKVGHISVRVQAPLSTEFPEFDMDGRAGNVRAGSEIAPAGARVEIEVKDEPTRTEPSIMPRNRNSLSLPPAKEIDIAAGQAEKLEFVIPDLGVLTGRITSHGKPVADEWIGLHAKATSSSFIGRFAGHVRTKTDQNGKYTFPPVAPGRYVVKKGDPGVPVNLEKMADPEKMMSASMEMAAAFFGNNENPNDLSRAVDITEGENRLDIDFGGSTIEVLVQDADDGSPVANATIRLFDYKNDPANAKPKSEGQLERIGRMILNANSAAKPVRLKTLADGKGRGEFKDVEGGSFRIIARAEGRPPSLPTDFDLNLGELRQIVVRVPKSVKIEGTVNDKLGNPIESATVRATETREQEPPYPDELLAMFGGHGPSTRTDKKGKFTLGGIEAGSLQVIASASGYAPALFQISAPSEGNQFFLEKAGSIKIRVLRAGAPVARAFVSLNKTDPDAPAAAKISGVGLSDIFDLQNHMDSTDDDGYATLMNVPPGDWKVDVRSFGSGEGPNSSEKQRAELESVVKEFDEVSKDSNDVPGKMSKISERVSKILGSQSVKVTVFAGQESTARVDLR